jgi:hypothetical protein
MPCFAEIAQSLPGFTVYQSLLVLAYFALPGGRV